MPLSARSSPAPIIETRSATPSRELFLDLGRAAAMFLMVQGHTVDAVMADDYRVGAAFGWWTFARGLTACIFLFVSGFAFAVWTFRARAAGRGYTLARRIALLIVIGYALHFPVYTVWELSSLDTARWHSFLITDVLQCIAMTLLLLYVLRRAAATAMRYAAMSLTGCAAIVLLTPWVWSVDWNATLPAVAAAYLSPALGSPFPLFPWTAYALLGSGIGALYVTFRTPASSLEPSRPLVTIGAIFVAISFVAPTVEARPFGPGDFAGTSPSHFLLHAGLVCVALGALAKVSPFASRWRGVIEPLAQQSLLVYVMHLVIVYGSIWNDGLHQIFGRSLSPGAAAAWVGVLWIVSGAAAFLWHTCARRAPLTATFLGGSTGGFLLGRLL